MKRVLCIWLPNWSAQLLRELCGWCQQFSPLVGIEEAAAPESLFLDITGLAHLFGGEAALGERVLRACTERGLLVRLAVADTLGAAWAVTHFGSEENMGLKPVDPDARLSRKRRFPISNFQFAIIPPGQVVSVLRPLPIEALRLPDDAVELLHALGVYRIDQFERLPREELAARFGPLPLERWDQAIGRLPEPILTQPVPPELKIGESLEYPTSRQDAIELILERLIGQVAQRLVALGRGALRLVCRLECPPGGESGTGPRGAWHKSGQSRFLQLEVGLFQPTVSPRHLCQLARLELERLVLPAPVTAISVEASITVPFDRPQEELFSDDATRPHSRFLAALVDRLSSRLGRKRVLRPRLLPDAQPEAACQYESWVEGFPKNRKAPRKLPPARSKKISGRDALAPGPRPLRLIRPPAAVEVISVVPDGPPVRFHWLRSEHCVARVWGPERIETAWWRGPMVARDYYRVETAAGRRYWLFRRLDDGKWFMHGSWE